MNFKNILETLDQLSEAVEKTKTGIKHTSDPGGYGRKFDTDEEGDEKKDKEPAAKRGRGRPKKGADDSGEVKKYDNAKKMQDFMIGNKPKSSKELDKLPAKKHTLKDWFEHVDAQFIAEAEQVTMEPAKQSTQVIKQGTKTIGTVTNPALAATIKSAIGKGEMSLAGDKLGEEVTEEGDDKKWIKGAIKHPGAFTKKAKSHGMTPSKFASKVLANKDDYPAKTEKQAVLAKTLGKLKEVEEPTMDNQTAMGAGLGAGRSQTTLEGRVKADNKAEKAGKKVTKDLEYDMGHKGKDDKKAEKAGKKVTKDIEYDEKKKKTVKEAAKPDYIDLDKDGNKKETMKKAAADKKKVKEGMNHRLQAARLEGKAHGLKGHAYHGKAFEDMEEARMYHEGFKEGLDECYGMKPIQGMVDEGDMPATVPGMASQEEEMAAMEAEMSEMDKTAYMQKKAQETPGDTFKAFGQTMKDKDVLEADAFAFEAWDRELQTLLTEGEEKIAEGMSVSISKGNQGAPDSVTVSAQDQEAEALLGLIKQAGLGLFGGEEQHSDYGAPDGSIQKPGGIEVVGDHDGMMGIMKKLSGIAQSGSDDYADEEDCGCDDEETVEAACNECGMSEGMHESGCSMGKGKEMVDEVETEDQMAAEVAEDNAPDSEEAEHTADEESEAQTDMALAKAAQQDKTITTNEGGDGPEASEETDQYTDGDAGEEMDASEEEEELTEWANNAGDKGTDASFERDIEFMMNVISSGLNKRKSTGQTTVPVIASQTDRQHAHETTAINESINDWKKLAGIK